MLISLAMRGGLAAAITRRLPPRVVDTAGLPPETTLWVRDLVSAASVEGSDPTRSGLARDAMSYTITVVDGGHSTTLTASDTAMPPAFGALLRWIERHAT